MRYLIGSGFVAGKKNEEMLELWTRNLEDRPLPEGCTKIVIIAAGGGYVPWLCTDRLSEWVGSETNLGHVGDLISGAKDYELCGWSASILALAMIAYCDGSDLIFVESDVLVFGSWVEQLYADLGDGDMAFGGKMLSEPFMEVAQGLFIIRHRFIPQFVAEYAAMGDERRKDSEGREDNLPERKFHRLREKYPGRIKTLSFGVDRERPIPYEAPVFYAQHLKQEEIDTLKEKGLL